MFNFIKKLLRKEPPAVGGIPRSPSWAAVRKKYLENNPNCAACGCCEDVEVHHKEPFHLNPSLELDENNLITLCRKGLGGMPCHYCIGHSLSGWDAYNPNVVEDAKWLKKIIENRVK